MATLPSLRSRPRPSRLGGPALLMLLVVQVLLGARAAAFPGSPTTPPLAGPPLAEVWLRPVPGTVLRPFDAPSSPFGRGHRGVDLASSAGAPVRAAVTGQVRFAGPVAGRSLVVIAHRGGLTTEYEPVVPTVRTGDAIPGGRMIGRLNGLHKGCLRACLHWAAKHGSAYFDPLVMLVPLIPVRLLPWDQARG